MSAFSYSFARWATESFDPLVAHLSVSTLFLLVVLLLAVLLRDSLTASSRFALVAVGMTKFAVPGTPFVSALERLRSDEVVGGATLPVDALGALGGAFRVDPSPASPSPWIVALVAVWLGVAALLVFHAMFVRLRLSRLALRSALPPDSREVEALGRARRQLGVRRSIDLARGAFPEAPAVIGILRPLVILPHGGCPDLSNEELETVLSHEVAHVRRHDNLIARLEFFVCALFWMNPLLWIAQRMAALDRERACDEAVASSEDRGAVYLDALSKFCMASIAPRLPGVSCMATAKLKERMDYVVNYPAVRSQSPSAGRMAFLSALALIIFTSAAGTVAAPARDTDGQPFALKVIATRAGDAITLRAAVTDTRTEKIVAAPSFTVGEGETGRAITSARGLDIELVVAPGGAGDLTVDLAIHRGADLVQRSTMRVVPSDEAAAPPPQYTGQPIDISLTNAEVRDVLSTFSTLTGLEIDVAPEVTGTTSVNWQNVPWDQALTELLEDQGLQYRLDGGTMYISKLAGR